MNYVAVGGMSVSDTPETPARDEQGREDSLTSLFLS
jgi:hypothetical protein